MRTLIQLSAPAMAFGMFLTTSSIGQVVQDRPVGQTPRTESGNTAILVDADRDGEALRRVSEILSGEARGPGDEGRIAAISDMIMDAEGRPHYVLLSRGGVAGLGGEKIAVPVQAAKPTRDGDGNWILSLPMTGDQLDQAPTLEDGKLTPLKDRNWVQANRQFFQVDPAGDESGSGDDSFFFRASALKDAQVHGAAGDDSIANVDDVILDAECTATYAILGYGGVAGIGKNQVPAPFSALNLSTEADDDRYRLVVSTTMTKERLQSDTAPKLDGEYERMLDPTFMERVESYFATDRPAETGATIRP